MGVACPLTVTSLTAFHAFARAIRVPKTIIGRATWVWYAKFKCARLAKLNTR
ncbi:hypothetical protein PILCRDRAFT_829461 [Piloderma croceum F 1598]|uniref:Uncharacterized protein n=1 Tax=Piloderma croceum (strain F 1598) TaxID=765440 RepID=A0A0C3EYA5_PILCF|nr:hypothetical protein PILCRDRAFT_829461 [Piloderma croceum F 1598]